jgi:hypothetical protein
VVGQGILAGNILRNAIVNVAEQKIRFHRVPQSAAILAFSLRPVRVEQPLQWSRCYAINANHRYFPNLAFLVRLQIRRRLRSVYSRSPSTSLASSTLSILRYA